MKKLLKYSRRSALIIVFTSLLSLMSSAPSHADNPGLIPQLQISLQRQNDFSIRITNFDPLFQYSAVSDKGAPIVDRAGNISIVNLQAGDTARVTVSTRRPGFFEGKASINGGVTGSSFINDASTVNASDGTSVAVVKASASPSASAAAVRSMSYSRSTANKYVFTVKSSNSEKLILKITLKKKSILMKNLSLQPGKELKISVAQNLKGATAQLLSGTSVIRSVNVTK